MPGLGYIYAQCGGGHHTPDIPAEQSNMVERIRMVNTGTEEEEIAVFGRRSRLRTPTAYYTTARSSEGFCVEAGWCSAHGYRCAGHQSGRGGQSAMKIGRLNDEERL